MKTISITWKNSQKARSFGRHHSDADFEGMGAKPLRATCRT